VFPARSAGKTAPSLNRSRVELNTPILHSRTFSEIERFPFAGAWSTKKATGALPLSAARRTDLEEGEMHGQREISSTPRVVCTCLHAGFLALAAWIYFGRGASVLLGWAGPDWAQPGDVGRRMLLLFLGVVIFVRMTLTLFVLLERRFDWSELSGVVFALLVYQVGFALLAVGETTPLDVFDGAALLVFLAGSALNTGSEMQRKRFKADPGNKGRLYTGGLFKLARHINYFGDVLWVGAWAFMTRNPVSALIPVLLAMGFLFAFIPSLSRHLRSKYGEQYERWEKETKAFIPFVY